MFIGGTGDMLQRYVDMFPNADNINISDNNPNFTIPVHFDQLYIRNGYFSLTSDQNINIIEDTKLIEEHEYPKLNEFVNSVKLQYEKEISGKKVFVYAVVDGNGNR